MAPAATTRAAQAGAVTAVAGPRRHAPRDLFALAAALAGPVAASGLLLPFRVG
jgi:hypothetical protein